jgi:hypothetical protein
MMDYAYQGKHHPTQLAAMVAHIYDANAHITADATNINGLQHLMVQTLGE